MAGKRTKARRDASTEAYQPFESVTIVGLGLMGGSLAKALRAMGFAGRILGVSSQTTIDAALADGAIDEGASYESLLEFAARSDLIVLAGPIDVILEQLKALGRAALRKGTIVTDVGSTKALIVATAVRTLPPGVAFIGGHPMAGSERTGYAASDPLLFENAYYVLTPDAQTSRRDIDRLREFLARTRAELIEMDPGEHDRTVAVTSHLPQFLAVALVNYLEQRSNAETHAPQLAAGGFRDMTRIASSSAKMWHEIFRTNESSVREAIAGFVKSLESAAVAVGDAERLELDFARAKELRDGLRARKGMLQSLHELRLVVADEPGTILQIASALRGINVKHFEVLKVREGDFGTIRLGFESEADRDTGARLLEESGIRVLSRDG